jgi:hypothetical protein
VTSDGTSSIDKAIEGKAHSKTTKNINLPFLIKDIIISFRMNEMLQRERLETVEKLRREAGDTVSSVKMRRQYR